MKKLLLLGGSTQQVIAIETAKKLGYFTILCDYLEDNPGQHVADKFYLKSTTDKEEILRIASEEKIDGILAYASDPAAPTAAYVSNKLNLPGNPYDSVNILCNKDLFRDFLKEHGFFSPVSKGYSNLDVALCDLESDYFTFPVIIKPVDSSGSKGVTQCNNALEAKVALTQAMRYSKNGRIIIEEFVDKKGYQIAGDGLSINGELVFRCFANDHFDHNCSNPFVPISASFPSVLPEHIQGKIHSEIQRLISLLNMKNCTYNFDIRVDKDDNVYLMEVAPRNGGNYIPQIIKYATGIDLVEYAIKIAMGEDICAVQMRKAEGFWSYYAVHALQDGILDSVLIKEDVAENNVVENHIFKQKNEPIRAFTGANCTLGCLIMKFRTMEEMIDMMENSSKWIEVRMNDQGGFVNE